MAFKRVFAGFAVGYVLGAKAGDKRYRELQGRWEDLRDNPTVQQVFERAREFAQSGGQRALQRLGIGSSGDAEEEPEEAISEETEDEGSVDGDDDAEISAEDEDEVEDEDDMSAEDDEEEDMSDDDESDSGAASPMGRIVGRLRERGRVA